MKPNDHAVRYAQAILDTSPEGIWTLGLDGRVMSVNKAALAMFGFKSPAQMLGLNSHDLVHHKYADGTFYPSENCPVYQAIDKGESVYLEDEVLWRADGTWFYADYWSTPIREDEKIVGAIIRFVDKTDQRRLQEDANLNRSWLAATLRGIGDAVIATDASAQPKVTFLNPVAEKLTGWTDGEARGRSVLEVFNIVDEVTRARAFDPIAEVLRTGNRVDLTSHSLLVAKDGREQLIEDSAAPIRSLGGDLHGVVLVFRDVTAERRTQQLADDYRRWLEEIIRAVPTPIYMADPETGEYTFSNAAMDALMGAPFPLGSTPIDQHSFLIARDPATGLAFLPSEYASSRAIRGEDIKDLRMLWDTPTGSYHVSITATTLAPGSGSPGSILLAVQNITELQNARESSERFAKSLAIQQHKLDALVAESSSAIGLMRGPDLVFEIANKKWRELVSKRDYIGRSYAEVYPEYVGTDVHESALETLRTGIPYSAREVHIKVETAPNIFEDRYLDYTDICIFDNQGNPYGVYCNALDVTERVTARAELERAKLEAERANEAKSSFLANMSHEIRTPLGAILGFTELLRETDLDEATRNQFLETIARNGKALTRIIDDILDLAKVESGKLEVETIDFAFHDLLNEIIELFRERARTKNIYLKLVVRDDVPRTLKSDPTRLRQILINIIGNAVKFTGEGGVEVTVSLHRREDQRPEIQVAVADTGPGLTRDQQSRLFQPFMQADNSTTRKFGGTGLGLALAQRLAQALSGKITVDAPNRGCVFTLTFVAL